MPERNQNPAILIVTVTEVESKAVIKVFGEATGNKPRPQSIGDRLYHDLGKVKGVHVFLALSEMGATGPGASQQAVQKAIAALCPSAVIMVGIAFGVNEQKQAIGDILVSRQLWLYELQRIGKNEISLRGDKPHASTWLINHLRGAELSWEGPKVCFGLVLSGEKLVDNLDYREQLKRFEAEAIGGEMEGGGVYVACQDSKVDWILVKAICDWADGNKGGPNKDLHQATAAYNAASFVLHALHFSPLKREAEAQIDIERDEQNDVQILVQAAKLLTSLRALDNAVHLQLGELATCDLGSLTKRREALVKQINDFAQREELIDHIRESLRTLDVLQVTVNQDDRELVLKIFECGADILRALSGSSVTPFPDQEALRDFLTRIKNAQTEQDVQGIIDASNKILALLDRGRLGAATEAYGTLKGHIQLRHPRLGKTGDPPPAQAALPVFTMISLSEECESWSKIGDKFERSRELAADPVFDIMVKYNSSNTIAVWGVGIRLLCRTPGIGGILGNPTDVEVHSQLKICCPLEWKQTWGNVDEKVETRFRNPKEMSRDNPRLRFTLMLKNFCDTCNASSCEIKFYLATENGTVESESIWLWQ